MFSRIYTIGMFFFAVALSSCERDVNVFIPKHRDMLVLNSGITSDSTFKVYVGRSIPLFDKTSKPEVDNAVVKVEWDGGELMLQSVGNGVYQSSAKPLIGKSYRVSASASGYDLVSATCTIPEPPVAELTAVSKVSSENFNSVYQVDITVDDPLQAEDYYIVEVRRKSQSIYNANDISYFYHSLTPKDLICEKVGLSGDSKQLLFKDVTFNGDKGRISFTFENAVTDLSTFECVVKRCSKDFWEYKRTLMIYDSTFDSPLSQPVRVHSNIENGVGIFGGYSSIVLQMK